MSINFKPHAHLVKIGAMFFQVNVRIRVPRDRQIGTIDQIPNTNTTPSDIVQIRIVLADLPNPVLADRWMGISSPVNIRTATDPIDTSPCDSHQIQVFVYDLNTAGNPKGKVIIRTKDADSPGG